MRCLFVHPTDRLAGYAAATFWYARPGATHNREPEPEEARRPVLEIAVLPGVRTTPGAIEGETLKIFRRTGGVTETQDDDRWSASRQLWWRDGKPGDRLELVLPVEKAGHYRVVMANTRADDYGIFQLRLDGENLGDPIDLYSRDNIDKRITLGTRELSAGEHRIEFEITGANPEAKPRHMLGLDYFLLQQAP